MCERAWWECGRGCERRCVRDIEIRTLDSHVTPARGGGNGWDRGCEGGKGVEVGVVRVWYRVLGGWVGVRMLSGCVNKIRCVDVMCVCVTAMFNA